MSTSSIDDETTTKAVHETSWSANLERPAHASDRERVVVDARTAVEHTAAGNHVNLVTHGSQGHPEGYLFEVLAGLDRVERYEYVGRCGCGGHVTRVHVA